MSRLINEEAAATKIHEYLREFGFVPRDADGSDFQRGTDDTLRFKVGTVYGEVTISSWGRKEQINAVRVLRDEQVVGARSWIRHQIDDHEGVDRIDLHVEGREEPVASVAVPPEPLDEGTKP